MENEEELLTLASTQITELRLCEQSRLILKPNRLYVFTVDATCDLCVALEKRGKP